MSQTTARPKAGPAYVDENPYGSTGNFGGAGAAMQPDGSHPVGMPVGKELDRAQALIATATRVAIKRNVPAIIQECRQIAASKGDAVFYRWEAKRKNGSIEIIEGCSIVGAMIAASTYGNCKVGAHIAGESATHWTFEAIFIDAEKGFNFVRTYQQRKSQSIGGKMDAERGVDMVYQIGQSKAIRNVIVGALGYITDEIVEAAKQGLIERISKAPDRARVWLAQQFAALDLRIEWVERIVTRKVADWTVPDMAKLMSQLSSVKEGFSAAADLWPSDAQRAQDNLDDEAQALREASGAPSEAARVAQEKAGRERAADEKPAAIATAADQPTPRPAAFKRTDQPTPEEKAEAETIVEADKAEIKARTRRPKAEKPPPPEPEPEPEPKPEPEPPRQSSWQQPADDDSDDDQGGLTFQ